MSELDLEESHLSDMTVGDFIETIAHLDPSLRLIEALGAIKKDAEHWKSKYEAQERLLKLIVQERDAALAGKKT